MAPKRDHYVVLMGRDTRMLYVSRFMYILCPWGPLNPQELESFLALGPSESFTYPQGVLHRVLCEEEHRGNHISFPRHYWKQDFHRCVAGELVPHWYLADLYQPKTTQATTCCDKLGIVCVALGVAFISWVAFLFVMVKLRL